MIDIWIAALLVIIVALISAIGTYTITKRRYYTKGKQDGITEFKSDIYRDVEFENKVNERLEIFRNSEELKMLLLYHTNLGEIQGAKNELAKFKIEYEQFLDIKDEFFKKKAESGYYMQLFYNGLPIGEPNKRIISSEEKFKEENAKELIDSVTQSIQKISSVATSNNIPINILPKVKRSTIK